MSSPVTKAAGSQSFRNFIPKTLSGFINCSAVRLKPIIATVKMLKRHLLTLLNYHHYRLTNATAEALNSRIQAIKARRARLPFLPKLPNQNPFLPRQTRPQPCLKSHGKARRTPLKLAHISLKGNRLQTPVVRIVILADCEGNS